MNERITKLARQAGFSDFPNDENGVWITDGYWDEQLERFAELVAEQTHTNNKAKWYQEGYEAGQRDEREACAKLCEDLFMSDGSWCAKAIRGRTE